MVAVRNYITEDRSLLNFHKGDIIRLQHMDGLEAGEMHRKKQKLTHIGPAVCFSEPCTVCPCFCVLHAVSVALCVRTCVCSGKYYGCIVRKKVMLLEELKRDTPEFGGFDSACLSVCLLCCLLLNLLGGLDFRKKKSLVNFLLFFFKDD